MTFYVNVGCLTMPIIFKYLNATSPRGSLDLMFFFTLSYEMMNQLTLTKFSCTLSGRDLDFLSRLSLLVKLFFTSDKYGDHVSLLSTVTHSKRDLSTHVIK